MNPGDDLRSIEDRLWQKLESAASDFRDPWHLPAVATLERGEPRVRTVVLRGVDRALGTIRFHTDVRSPKVAQIESHSTVSCLFYAPGDRTQLRMRAEARVETEGELVDRCWAETNAFSRRCYLAPHPPSATIDHPDPNLPEPFRNDPPTEEESAKGRANFGIVVCRATHLDWLQLAHDGHVRCTFERAEDRWQGGWTTP